MCAAPRRRGSWRPWCSLFVLAVFSVAVVSPVVAGPNEPAPGTAPATSGTAPATSGNSTPAPGNSSPAPGAPATLATPSATAKAPASPVVAPVVTASGATVSSDLRDRYVAGFPILVTLTVSNPTAASVTFPDLSARPHLVKFSLAGNGKREERYSTPPAVDGDKSWTIPPRGQRRVILQIPSSGALSVGNWDIGISVGGATTAEIPARPVTLVAAAPLAGDLLYEPTVTALSGAVALWQQPSGSSVDLYLQQSAPRNPASIVGQFFLTRLPAATSALLTHCRPGDAPSRYLHWPDGESGLTFARLDGTVLAGPPQTVRVPYPKIVVLDRGVTDGKGGADVPIWIPAPKGSNGSVKLLGVDERGKMRIRGVAEMSSKPTAIASMLDAAGGMVLAIGQAAGVDVYRVDPATPVEIPAKGKRAFKPDAGWTPAAFAFDTLPDQAGQSGGQAILTVLTSGSNYRSFWVTAAGATFGDSGEKPLPANGALLELVGNGYGPFVALLKDKAGTVWYGTQGGTASKVPGYAGGTLILDGKTAKVRKVGGAAVVEERVLGTL